MEKDMRIAVRVTAIEKEKIQAKARTGAPARQGVVPVLFLF